MLRRLSPTAVIILGFLAVILIGGILLCLPFSSAGGTFTSPIDAFFVATSAACVTGLSTVSTALHWSVFGKCVILLLVQIGGLGFMSLAMLFSQLLKRKVSPRERAIFAESMNLPNAGNAVDFLKKMFITVLAAETGGAVLLALRFVPQFGWGTGIAYSVFHSVSAFCNAGFDLFGDSLIGYQNDGYVLGVIGSLIVFGGLGFAVWDELAKWLVRRERLSLYARMVLGVSGGLLLFGASVYLAAEWNNPQTVGNMSVADKLANGIFQSVTMRTAGFASFDHGGMTPVSLLVSLLLMFIGGSSGSTAGGVKTVTFAVLLIAAVQILRGNREIRFRGRRLSENAVFRAFALVCFGAAAVFVSILVLSFAEDFPMGDLAYEVVSAFGTVGNSTGITGQFGTFGKLWLMLLMFLGRLGIASVTYTLLLSVGRKKNVVTYPKADLMIG